MNKLIFRMLKKEKGDEKEEAKESKAISLHTLIKKEKRC